MALKIMNNDFTNNTFNGGTKFIIGDGTPEQKCLQGFDYSDYSTYRSRRVPKHLPGTLKWVLNHEAYKNWVSTDSGSTFLWISGNPGCGKTVLSKFLLETIEQVAGTATDNLTKVVYFFCDDKEEKQKSAQSLLLGLIHQLIHADQSLIKHAMPFYDSKGPNLYQSFDTLWKIFLAAATDPCVNGTYVILDALDECEKVSRQDLLRQLGECFQSESTSNVFLKILMTSRPYEEINNVLKKQPAIRLKTEDEAGHINCDIEMFISTAVKDLAELRGYDFELKQKVMEVLRTKVDGMFLWASLVIAKLEDTPTFGVLEELRMIPPDIRKLYIHLLKQLHGYTRQLAKNVLLWVAMAPYPMTVAELATACTIKTAKKDTVNTAGFKDDLTLCGPMIKLQDNKVILVHQSAKDFLLSPQLLEECPEFGINETTAYTKLAVDCLTYLSGIDSGPLSNHGFFGDFFADPIISHYKLLRFAATEWPGFVRRGDETNVEIWDSFWQLAQSKPQFNLALQSLLVAHKYTKFREITPLQATAYLGFYNLTHQVLKQETDKNASNRLFGTALHAATLRGDEAIIQLLLDYNSDINITGAFDEYAISIAILKGHMDIVEIFKKHGAKQP